MTKPSTTFVVIGGGDLAESTAALKPILEHLRKISDPRIVVMTVATNESRSAAAKYNNLLRTISSLNLKIDAVHP